MHHYKLWLPGLLFFLPFFIKAQPLNYYNGTENLSGEDLKSALHQIIKDQVDFSYNRSRDIINYSDQDPENPENVILFYLQESRNAGLYGQGGDNINREHVWAKSHGNFSGIRNMNGDAFNLRPADASVNEDRGNKDFDNVQPNGTRHYEATQCWYTDYAWEPGPATKGQVARILFYMATRYEGTNGELDLELIDGYSNIPLPEHGKLSTLLEWNNSYPPSDLERQRNERIFRIQQNRNPFVDNPDFANLIWAGKKPGTIQFSELQMYPEYPLPGQQVTISTKILSETLPDSVVLYWGKSFDSTDNRKLLESGEKYSTVISFNDEQPGEMVYFGLKAYTGTDSCISRGSYLLPESTDFSQLTPISDIQGNGFESPLLNQKVTVSGRITGVYDYSFFVQDSRNPGSGINIYNSLHTGKVGDSVIIRGTVDEYATLTEIKDIEYFYNFGNNRPVEPVTITCSQIGEAFEGMLVKIKNVTFADQGRTIREENATYSFSDNTGQSLIFSNYNSRIVGKQLPWGMSNLVGIVSQYNGGYQIVPRDIHDLNLPTKTNDLKLAGNTLHIYPNPVKSIMNISGISNIQQIEIYGANGNFILETIGSGNFVDLSSYPAGLYYIKVITEDNRFAGSKFIKQ